MGADSLACKVARDDVAAQLSRFDQAIAEILSQPTVSPLACLALNGRDILSLGVKSGPVVGEVLRAMHELVLDNPELNDREILLKRAKAFLQNSG